MISGVTLKGVSFHRTKAIRFSGKFCHFVVTCVDVLRIVYKTYYYWIFLLCKIYREVTKNIAHYELK